MDSDTIIGSIFLAYAVFGFFLQPYSFRIAQAIGMPSDQGSLVISFFLNPVVTVLSNMHTTLIAPDMLAWLIGIFYYVWAGIFALIGIYRLMRD